MAQGDRPRNLNSTGLTLQQVLAAARNNPVETAVLASQAIPVVGDIAGAAYDAYDLASNPESRTPLNFGLAAAGMLPFVPGGLKAGKKLGDALATNKMTTDINGQGYLPGMEPTPENLGFTEDVFHYTSSPTAFDHFNPSLGTDKIGGIGPHVGTAEAAADRHFMALTSQNPQHVRNTIESRGSFPLDDVDLVGDYPEVRAKYMQSKWAAKKGHTLPLKARLNKPFTVPGTDDPWTEGHLRLLLDHIAEKNKLSPLSNAAQEMLHKDLASKGYTHIPYINDVEDYGNLSHILLTNRPGGQAVVRNRFAAFDPAKLSSPDLMAGIGGVAGAGVGTSALANALAQREQQQVQ